MISLLNRIKCGWWPGLALLLYMPSIQAAQFTFNVPINAQFYRPADEFKVYCGLYRLDEASANIIKETTLNFDDTGDYVALVTIEFDQVVRPYEITHYACHATPIDANPGNADNEDSFGPEGSCWSSTQEDAELCIKQDALNQVSRNSTGKTSLPIQYEY